MQKNFFTLFGLMIALTAWTSAGHYAQAADNVYHDKYYDYIESIDQELEIYAEKRYQKVLAIARAREKKAYEDALALQQAQELALRQAAERARRVAEKAWQEKQRLLARQREDERQKIAAHNAIVNARETAIQLLAQSGGDISAYTPIPTRTTTNQVSAPRAVIQTEAIAVQRQAALDAATAQKRRVAEQTALAERRRQEALAKAEADIKAQKIAKAKKKKKSRRSRAS